MTLERRRRRNSDIFDTGAFGNYRSLGNGEDENGSQQANFPDDFDPLDYDSPQEAEQAFGEYDRQEAGEINYNPQIPTSEYETGEYIVPNVGQATMHNQTIPTNRSKRYWDGQLATHDWALHGCSTPLANNE